ncbi:3-ketoacyl-CoA synthase 2-like [Vicia villosa]|uniref:3-ketoacyl-CoA synthase 2-like n=1 Tax=Vicia villosa TaxID=3911 RepID=UPI00273BCAA1|nr:3-ketoacyl-CoA synthase 2-like [Vicia villosa]XP_058762033.1 3-ketoacyl-CoA synthase 2-like [Vicia villosa]
MLDMNPSISIIIPMFTMLFFLSVQSKFSTIFNNEKFLDIQILFNSSNIFSLLLWCTLIAFIAIFYQKKCSKKVFLVDFACYKPSPRGICSKETFIEKSKSGGHFKDESILFQKNIIDKSGIGGKAYLTESLLKIPPCISTIEARKETESVIFGAIDELLLKTKMKVEDIKILITNCSIFNPSPSLSAMVINHYKLKHQTLSYNLSGMGCSAGLISIDLAKQLLQVHPNSYALVVSTENMNSGYYLGNNKSMLVSNCLFRVAGAAILLSNISSDSHCSKYHLKHTVRTHKGSQDICYNSVFQKEDETNKIIGVSLSKDLTSSAGFALKENITTLGKYVLPLLEQVKFVSTFVLKKYFNNKVKIYTPDFKLCFEHFCIHTGGKAVLDEMQKLLGLSDVQLEPSRMALYRYGNTSSSSTWYVLAYCEAKGRIKKGDRIWQIAFGSGLKCNTAVWCALRNVDPIKEINLWSDEINEFPVNVSI